MDQNWHILCRKTQRLHYIHHKSDHNFHIGQCWYHRRFYGDRSHNCRKAQILLVKCRVCNNYSQLHKFYRGKHRNHRRALWKLLRRTSRLGRDYSSDFYRNNKVKYKKCRNLIIRYSRYSRWNHNFCMYLLLCRRKIMGDKKSDILRGAENRAWVYIWHKHIEYSSYTHSILKAGNILCKFK